MLTLTVEAIKDFQVCELFYDFRYRKEENELHIGRELMAQRFENTLKKVASFFFYRKQAGVTPSYNALINRWEKLWFPKDMDAYDLAVEQHEVAHGNLASYSNAAAMALMQFHEDFSEDFSDPILIGESFLITMGPNLRLEGTIDLVLRKAGEYRVIMWSGKTRRPSVGSLILDFAAQKMAFEYRNENMSRSASYGMYDLASSKPGYVPVEPSKDDVSALQYWANSIVSKDDHEEVYVPRRGYTAYCKGCPFDRPCEKWNGWPGAK